MSPAQTLAVTAAVLAVAFLYASVGHAGGSGYIAVMALAGLAPAVIKPTALILNVVVASIGSWQFHRAGHFSWRLFWPFAVLSIPGAFLGGYLHAPPHLFKILIGVVLLYAAAVLFARPVGEGPTRSPARGICLAAGGVLGFLSGLVGVGGGIFLTPLLILTRWARTKTAAATSAVFILVNSVSGLAGVVTHVKSVPAVAAPLLIAVLIGGACGSYLGSRRFSSAIVRRLLACVLVVAAGKMLFT